MSTFSLSLILLAYILGFVLIGVPMAIWSLRAWRKRNGKKYCALLFLFPVNCFLLNERAFRQGMGTYECGQSLLHSMVSESALLNSAYDLDSRLACAQYVFVSALAWPLRLPYLVVLLFVTLITLLVVEVISFVPMWGGKLILACKKDFQF